MTKAAKPHTYEDEVAGMSVFAADISFRSKKYSGYVQNLRDRKTSLTWKQYQLQPNPPPTNRKKKNGSSK